MIEFAKYERSHGRALEFNYLPPIQSKHMLGFVDRADMTRSLSVSDVQERLGKGIWMAAFITFLYHDNSFNFMIHCLKTGTAPLFFVFFKHNHRCTAPVHATLMWMVSNTHYLLHGTPFVGHGAHTKSYCLNSIRRDTMSMQGHALTLYRISCTSKSCKWLVSILSMFMEKVSSNEFAELASELQKCLLSGPPPHRIFEDHPTLETFINMLQSQSTSLKNPWDLHDKLIHFYSLGNCIEEALSYIRRVLNKNPGHKVELVALIQQKLRKSNQETVFWKQLLIRLIN